MRLPKILRRVNNVKNFFSPINQLPLEILAHTATFFVKERDLINATAVCQRWRTTLLSFPLLWRNAGGSSSEIQAYVERSKSTLLDVDLSRPSLVDLIIPHFSRLVGLTVRLDESSNLSEFIHHMRHPIPTLRVFRISSKDDDSRPRLTFPSDLKDPFFFTYQEAGIEGYFGGARVQIPLCHRTRIGHECNLLHSVVVGDIYTVSIAGEESISRSINCWTPSRLPQT